MKITVIKLQGKGDGKADYVSLHHFDFIEDVDNFIEENTISGKYWTVSFIVHEGDKYETGRDVHAE